MRRFAIALLTCPLLGGSALAQVSEPLSGALRQAEAERAAAEAETARLERAAANAQTEAGRLHAQQAAAAQAIDAAEARINAADARLQLVSASVAMHRQQLASEQQPVSSLLAGLAEMARRPPLLALADRGGLGELVKVRILLDSTLPVIRKRTGRLSAELAEGQRLQQATLVAREELGRSRDNLSARRNYFAALEQTAVQRSVSSGQQALGTGDVAMAAGEQIERLRDEQANSLAIRSVASRLAGEDAAPLSPFGSHRDEMGPPFAYQLPAVANVVEGLSAVDASGVRSRGLTLATQRGVAVSAPADGVVRFAGPFRDYDGVLIIDHGSGWLSLIVNVASELHAGDRVKLGDNVGRALGSLQVELSQNGQRISPALIAGSSRSLSKEPKGG